MLIMCIHLAEHARLSDDHYSAYTKFKPKVANERFAFSAALSHFSGSGFFRRESSCSGSEKAGQGVWCSYLAMELNKPYPHSVHTYLPAYDKQMNIQAAN